MEFTDLPSDFQKVAVRTLCSILEGMGTEIESEPAKPLARNIKDAFIELHQINASSDSECGFKRLAASLSHFAMKDLLKYQEFQKCTHKSLARVRVKMVVDFSST
ncbi:Uncharacterised protein [Buttiauxella agrestis]|uniref:Uncharacterized protein n=1 Tax=Buttiauxella agrestis TaxID=82977 RepID=A0A381C5Q8_9ENTR|nr:hypothetical protein [Buttiauxella agrestis]SUW63264.1 Uncharacterised protein [Buttiauxella agrestis]